jgi:hypothetical protein
VLDLQCPEVTLEGICGPVARFTLLARDPLHDKACKPFVIACTIEDVANMEKLVMEDVAQ